MNVGDLIEGGTTDRQQLALEWDSFDDRAKGAPAPVFYTGGNHDLTNMTMREVWELRYGARYYYFTYQNVLFLVLDTEDNTPERMQDIFEARAEAIALVEKEGWGVFAETRYSNMPEQTAGTIGTEQSDYFQRVIADHPGVRWTFRIPGLSKHATTISRIKTFCFLCWTPKTISRSECRKFLKRGPRQ